jgi:hypothetical protein
MSGWQEEVHGFSGREKITPMSVGHDSFFLWIFF